MPPIRSSVAFAVLLFASVGCGKKDGAAPTTKASSAEVGPIVPTPPSAAIVGDSGAAPLKTATEFLKAVQEGKATSASLTPAFKKVIAPWELEADKAAGYSESGVRDWFARIKDRIGTTGCVLIHSTPEYAIAKASMTTGPSHGPANTYLHLVRSGAAWSIEDVLIDYVFGEFAIPDGERAAPSFAAWSFADAQVNKKIVKAEARMSKSLKAMLAPPLFDTDAGQGYSSSKLKSALEELFPNPHAVTKIEVSGVTGKYELRGAKKTFDFKLVSGPTPGSFLIDDLQQK